MRYVIHKNPKAYVNISTIHAKDLLIKSASVTFRVSAGIIVLMLRYYVKKPANFCDKWHLKIAIKNCGKKSVENMKLYFLFIPLPWAVSFNVDATEAQTRKGITVLDIQNLPAGATRIVKLAISPKECTKIYLWLKCAGCDDIIVKKIILD